MAVRLGTRCVPHSADVSPTAPRANVSCFTSSALIMKKGHFYCRERLRDPVPHSCDAHVSCADMIFIVLSIFFVLNSFCFIWFLVFFSCCCSEKALHTPINSNVGPTAPTTAPRTSCPLLLSLTCSTFSSSVRFSLLRNRDYSFASYSKYSPHC